MISVIVNAALTLRDQTWYMYENIGNGDDFTNYSVKWSYDNEMLVRATQFKSIYIKITMGSHIDEP